MQYPQVSLWDWSDLGLEGSPSRAVQGDPRAVKTYVEVWMNLRSRYPHAEAH